MPTGRMNRDLRFQNRDRAFVGRKRELSILGAALQRAGSGLGSVLLLSGEAGVGKTLLVQEFSCFARSGGAKVLEGHASVRFRDVPFEIWKQILCDQPDRREGSQRDFLRFEDGTAPPASLVLQPLSATRIDPELIETMARTLVEHARTQPLVLVLDDLYAADLLSLRAFRVLARELSRFGTLIIGVYRDPEIKRFPEFGELLLDPLIRDSKRISLAAFDDEEIRKFVKLRTTCPLNEETLACLHTLTGGNPRLLDIVFRRHLLDESSERPGEQLYGLLREIEAHLEHLSEQAREVLSVASLAGLEFRLSLLFHVLDREPAELLDSIDEAQQSGLLKSTEIPGNYRFRQTLVQEILHAEITGARRARLHKRFAEVLEALHPRDGASLEAIARHYYEAALLGCAATAAEYCSRAASHACSESRMDDGLRFYHMALAALEFDGSNPDAICDLKARLDDACSRRAQVSSREAQPSKAVGNDGANEATPDAKAKEKKRSSARSGAKNGLESALGAEDSEADPPRPEMPENTFRREGDFWTLSFEGQVLRLKHSNGLLFVAHLLQHPERDFHVFQLVALLPSARARHSEPTHISRSDKERLGIHDVSGGDWHPLLDSTAKADYRRRIDELRAELEQAKSFNDGARAAHLEQEIEFIGHELSRAVGVGGRDRKHPAQDERARVNVTNAIRTLTAKIAKEHLSFCRYLRLTIWTGRYCSYRPEPHSARRWRF